MKITRFFQQVALVALMALCGCRENIVHNLSESDANRLITRLHDVNITAAKERQPDGNWSISTSRSESLRAIKYLDDSRFFRRANPSGEEEQSMLASPEERRARSNRQLSRELEASLRSIDGILEAHVHLNRPISDSLFGGIDQNRSGSASVVITTVHDSGVKSADLQAIVSGATGIPLKDVNVLVTSGSLTDPEREKQLSLPSETRGTIAESPSDNRLWLVSIGGVLLIAAATLFIALRRQGSRQNIEVGV